MRNDVLNLTNPMEESIRAQILVAAMASSEQLVMSAT